MTDPPPDSEPMPRPMIDRAEALRRRIALYRNYLRGGVSAGLAAEYLREIAAAEAELAEAARRKSG